MHKAKSITYVGYRITESCNKHCPFCFSREKNIALDQSLEDIDKFLQNLKRAGITAIGVMGGEPLVRSDIVDILKLVKSHGFESILSTNATLLTEELLEKINSLIDFMSISLDADGADVNDKYRGINQFDSAVTMISKYDPKIHKFSLKVNTVVHKQNIREGIDNIPRFFSDKPIIWKLLQYTPRLAGKLVRNQFEISIADFIRKGESLKRKYPDIKIALRTYAIDEKFDLLILRPNGELKINYGDEYKIVGNANTDEIADVIANVWHQQRSYFLENWDEFEESYRFMKN